MDPGWITAGGSFHEAPALSVLRYASVVSYLDYNATTPLLPEVQVALAWATEELWANPSSPHAYGRKAAAALEDARAEVARLVARPPHEVTFTSGATEANAWLLGSIARGQWDTRTHRTKIVATAVEHPSVRAWASALAPVDRDGVVDLEALASLLDDSVAIVSVMAANNETGVIQPIAAVRMLTRAHGIPLHVDATQVPGKVALALDADFLTLSAHKFGGPKGVGCLVGASPPAPILVGGGQERGRRAGTVNVPGIVGMGAAAKVARTRSIDPSERDRLEACCRALGARILGDGAPRLPNTCMALFDVPGDLVVMALDLEGVAASTGSACASGAHETSAGLAAMGVIGTPVRFSLGPDTKTAGVVDLLPGIIERLRSSAG